MKTILIKEIKKGKQHYNTVGNYRKLPEYYLIEVSKEKGYVTTEQELKGVALHEIIEMWLCLERKIKFKDIDKWDMNYKGKGEPGEAKGCPYRKEHKFANKIEKLLLKELYA